MCETGPVSRVRQPSRIVFYLYGPSTGRERKIIPSGWVYIDDIVLGRLRKYFGISNIFGRNP